MLLLFATLPGVLGVGMPLVFLCGLAFCLAVRLLNEILIAYVKIPAIFAMLAMGTAVHGFGPSDDRRR